MYDPAAQHQAHGRVHSFPRLSFAPNSSQRVPSTQRPLTQAPISRTLHSAPPPTTCEVHPISQLCQRACGEMDYCTVGGTSPLSRGWSECDASQECSQSTSVLLIFILIRLDGLICCDATAFLVLARISFGQPAHSAPGQSVFEMQLCVCL